MKEYLFVFHYESPEEYRAGKSGGAAPPESWNAVWVDAASKEEAIERGRAYAEGFVAARFRSANAPEIPSWREGNFAHRISRRPLKEFSGLALETFARI